MYRSKHQKGYLTSHEAQTTHFRTWKSGKKWLYGATLVVLTGSALLPATNLAFVLTGEVYAATTSTGLNPGTPVTTPNVNVLTSANLATSNWGTGSFNNTTGNQWSGSWYQMNVLNDKQYSILPYNNTINMASSFSMSIGMKGVAGDNQGVYFVPAGTTTAQLVASATQYNSNLGIGGIPNAVFAGRDFWYNSDQGDSKVGNTIILTQLTTGNQMRIATTNSSGTLNASGTTSTAANPVADAGSVPSGGETIAVVWTPTTIGATTVTGNLQLTVNGTTITYSGLVMQRQMLMGLNANNVNSPVGSNGQPQFNITGGSLSANLTGLANVNYLNSVTGSAMKPNGTTWAATAITGNLGDTVGILAPGGAVDASTYDYTAPSAPVGYTFSSITGSPATLSTSNATVNVSYTPIQQTVNFNWARSGTSTVPATLPVNKSYGASGTADTSVVTDAPFASTTSLKNYATDLTSAVPAGYNITSITNGTSTYTGATTAATLAAFTAANPTVSATQANNNYTVTLTAAAQTATFTYNWDTVNTPGATSATMATLPNGTVLPPTVSTSGTTGSAITYPTFPASPVTGYSITGYVFSGTTYTTITALKAAYPNYLASGNAVTIILAANKVWNTWNVSLDLGTVSSSPDNVEDLQARPPVIPVGSPTPNNQDLMLATNGGLTTTDDIVYTGPTGAKYIVTGYEYHAGSTSSATTATYSTFAELLAAHPTIGVGGNNTHIGEVTVDMILDNTALTTNKTTSTTPLTSTTGYNYNPSSDITSSTDINGSDDDSLPYTINGYNAVTNIVGGTTNYWGDVTNPLKLLIGSYTETYYALNYLGVQAYKAQSTYPTVASFIQSLSSANLARYTVTSTTQLTVTNFILPFAGGSGNQFLYLMISLVAIGALGLYFSKRRKDEEYEFVPEQADRGASTNNNGSKARFFQILRKTRPYRKVFHSKNRIHLAQMQRKEGIK